MVAEALQDTADAVVAMCSRFSADNPEGRAQLAAMTANMREWFASPERQVTDAAQYCIDKLIDAEMDNETPTDRGLGRVTDACPRLGARHRAAVSAMTNDQRTELRRLLRRHMLCGYAFYERGFETQRADEARLSPERLFEMWITTLYTPTTRFQAPSKDHADLYQLWFDSTARSIRDHLRAGETWQQIDSEILTYYFDGGMTLRHFERDPLTEEQVRNFATGGVSEAEKAVAAETGGNYTVEQVYNRVSQSGWPTLSDQELFSFSDEARAFIRKNERELIEGNKNELAEINATCTIRPQYAKTYRVLRRSKRETLEKMKANLRSWPMPEEAKTAFLRIYDQVISYKHAQMAIFFKMKWGEDIEVWAGKENSALDRSGCVVMIATILSVAASFVIALL